MSTRGFAQISNSLWSNDKATSLALEDPESFSMWIMAIDYCSDKLTDGLLTPLALRRIMCPPEVADRLVAKGFFDRDGGNWRVHDYLDWQNSREDVERETEQVRERKRRQRRRDRASEGKDGVTGMSRVTSRVSHAPKTKTKTKIKPNPSSFDSSSVTAEEKKKDQDDAPVTMTYGWRPRKASLDWADHTWAGMDTEIAAIEFARHWAGQARTPEEWDREWRGWIINRASKRHLAIRPPHKHTWACEHTLRVLGMTQEEALNHLDLAYRVRNSLNQGMGEEECRRRLLEREAGE